MRLPDWLYHSRVQDGIRIRRWGSRQTGSPGLGFYFRGMTEHVLFGTRGKLGIPAGLRRSNVITAARGKHSAKPGAFMDLVESVRFHVARCS